MADFGTLDPLARPAQLVAEAAGPADGWWTGVGGCTRTTADAGARALRVEPPPSVPLAERAFVELRKTVLRPELDFIATVVSAKEAAFFRRVGVGALAACVRCGSGRARFCGTRWGAPTFPCTCSAQPKAGPSRSGGQGGRVGEPPQAALWPSR